MASSSASTAAVRLKNEQLERQIAEMEAKSKSRGVSSSSASIQLKNEQLERQIAEMEAKSKSRGVSSSSASIQLKNEQLERQIAEMEAKTKKSVGDVDNGMLLSPASAAIRLRNDELQRKIAAMAVSSKTKPGMSPESVAVHRKNEDLERRLAEMEKRAPSASTFDSRRRLEMLGEGHPLRSDPLVDKIRQSRVKAREVKLMQIIKDSQELDLAFLLDVTGSMEKFIKRVKEIVPDIAASVKKQWPDLKLRVAFAPYRDYEDFDRDNLETCDFTTDFSGPQSVFVKALSRIIAGGGGDVAEDVFSGLERVARLSWRSRTRVVVHIADAPCHGAEFHTGGDISDEYLGGDMKGRNVGGLLKALRDDRRILCYLFVHVNSITHKMLKAFKRHAGDGNWIHEEKLSTINKLANIVISVASQTISRSMQFDGAPQASKFTPMTVKPEKPVWHTIAHEKARQIMYKFPESLEDLFNILSTNGELERVEMPDSWVQIGPSPFSGDGSIRWPFHAMVHQPPSEPRPMVVKRFKTPFGQDVNKVHALEAYLEQMEVQTVAAYMAQEFNEELESRSYTGDYKTVDFTMVSILVVMTGTGQKYYNMEKYLKGRWIRYTNNLNYVNTEDYAATLHAFSHWTYDRSNGIVMVTDLQGVKGNEYEFWLCDPALLCKDALRYERTRTNFGSPGMKRFLDTHQCNSICHSLGLKPTRNAPTVVGTQLT